MGVLMEEQSSDLSVASDNQTVKASNVDRARRVSLSPKKGAMADAARSPLEDFVETFLRNHRVQWSETESSPFLVCLVYYCKGVLEGHLTEESFILSSRVCITQEHAHELYERLQDYQAEPPLPGQDPDGEQSLVSTLTTSSTGLTVRSTVSNSGEHLIAGAENSFRAGRNVIIDDDDNVLAQDSHAQDGPNSMYGDSQAHAPHQDSESGGTLGAGHISSVSASSLEYSASAGES